MKRYFRRHMHRIMIDLPKNLVVELKRKTKKHYKKAKKRVKDKAAALDRKMAKVNKELQALMKNMSSESKQQTMKLLALFKKEQELRSKSNLAAADEEQE